MATKLTIQKQVANITKHVLKVCPGKVPFISATYWAHLREPKIEFTCGLYSGDSLPGLRVNAFALISYKEAMAWKPKSEI